jgi:predicted Zn-dependent peptidase
MRADPSPVRARADRSQAPAVGPDPDFRFPEIARHTLTNGLQVRTVHHDAAPVITFVVQVEGGSGADPSGKEGLAAIVADMLDEGTGSLSAIDVSDALARLGADYDIDVAPDVTTLSLTTLTRFAGRGAALLSDLVTKPSFREHDFERVRQLRLDRLTQLKDLPPAVAERAFLRLLYGQHPYGHMPLGSAAALQRLSLEEAVAFHHDTFDPSQTTLVVGGPHPHGELLRIAEEAFGGWVMARGRPRAGSAAADVPAAPSGGGLAVLPREAASQSELRIGHLSVRRNTPDYPALIVMNAVLGGQFVSRLNLKLREEKGYTYGARTGFDWRRGMSPFELQTSVHTAVTAEAVRDSLAEIEAIRGARPVSDGELTLAKASLTRGYPRNFETVQQVARSVAQLALYSLPDSYFAEFVPKVNAVSAGDVTAAAARYLDPAKLTTLIVGDHSAIAESLSTLGFDTIDVLPPEP